MKRFKWTLIALLGLVAGGVFAQAALRPVAQPNAFGASHALTLRHTDLSESTATNTAAIVTNTIPAGTVLAFKGMYLNQPFTDGLTSTTNTVQAKLGYGGSDAFFLPNTSVAMDSTPVYASLGPETSFMSLTNVVGTSTNVYTVATGLGPRPYRYSSAGQLLLTVTPNTALKLSDLAYGSATFYFLALP